MGRKTEATTATRATAGQSAMLAGIAKLLEVLEAEARALEGQEALPATKSGGVRGPGGGGSEGPAPEGRSLEDLEVMILWLRQLLEWLQQDPRLLPLVDAYIGQQVRAMETRQIWRNVALAVVTTVAGALLGWFTSLLGTPITIWHAVGH